MSVNKRKRKFMINAGLSSLQKKYDMFLPIARIDEILSMELPELSSPEKYCQYFDKNLPDFKKSKKPTPEPESEQSKKEGIKSKSSIFKSPNAVILNHLNYRYFQLLK